jgi:NitT/TauT family transport system substrate-binding protein
MQIAQSRRDFLAGLSAAGAAAILGRRQSLADERPPETTTLRLSRTSAICTAPEYIASDLLRLEGFTDIQHIPAPAAFPELKMIENGEVDFCVAFALPPILELDAGNPLTLVALIHAGCYELFARGGISSIKELKDKSVGVAAIPSGQQLLLSAMASYVGLDPGTDIKWVTSPTVRPMELFAEGKIDAFIGFPPEPQELRARNIGHVIVNTTLDRPWSQYLCCVLTANSDFVREHPVATKRVVRAILKATDLCAAEPERVARRLVDGGFAARYDYTLQTLQELPYRAWREYDPEDAIRFYALRLREAGIIKSSPNKIIAEGADWRFLNELKRELKA